MPKLQTESYGAGDQTWLGSTHGIANARTAVIDISTFTRATHFPNGFLPSGTPVNADAESAVKPFTGAAGEELGFVLTDQAVVGTGDFGAPVLRHGIINVSNVPGTFEAPEAAAGFVFVSGGAS